MTGTHRIVAAMVAVLVGIASAKAQSPPDPHYVRQQVFPSYQAFKDELAAISATADAAARTVRLNTLWTQLRAAGQTPYAQGNQMAFLWRGSATSVSVAGDFNSWSATASRATQVAGTDLWVRELTLPSDARVDYKIVTGGNNWVLDPANPLQMWSGFGPNSELRMPSYDYPEETIRRPGVARGSLSGNVVRSSAALGYSIQHRVYTPAGFDPQTSPGLPVVYVTDGHEYAADHMGSLVAVLDNLIDDGSIRPTIAVFVDPRNPTNLSSNRRQSEYVSNRRFADYLADELVPAIDGAFATSTAAEDRVILGTSLGGLAAAYVGAVEPATFGRVAIQSPAFWASTSIYDQYRRAPVPGQKISMTAGTINDGSGGPTMAAILQQFGYDYTYDEANEGHSWGNWRAQLPAMLRELVGPAQPLPGDFNGDGLVNAADYTVWRDNLGTVFTEADYGLWAQHYGGQASDAVREATVLAAAAVPEPTAWAMALGIAATWRGFRP
jgi:enterochelin esterase family protein